jgi:hypothetical protein
MSIEDSPLLYHLYLSTDEFTDEGLGVITETELNDDAAACRVFPRLQALLAEEP